MRQSPPSAIISEDGEISMAPVPHLNDQGLRATLHRARVLGGTLVIATIIASIILLFRGEGVILRSFPADELTGQELKRLLDYYNSIPGSIGSLVVKPVELFLGLLILGHWQYLPVLTGAALAYLFSNGLNSLNVQLTPDQLRPRITAADLAFTSVKDDQPVLENGSLATRWDRRFRENTPRNPVLSTILRLKLLPLQILKSPCNGTGWDNGLDKLSALPLMTFGFLSQSWHMEILATALEPSRSLKILMSIKNTNELQNGNAIVPFSTDVASNLVLIGKVAVLGFALDTNLNAFDPLSKQYERVADNYNLTSPVSASHAAASKLFLNGSHALWQEALDLVPNVTVDDASVECIHHDLSEGGSNIKFDAVTLKISSPREQTDKTKAPYIKIEDFCSRNACMMPASDVPFDSDEEKNLPAC